jgi:hypothetical protein
VRVHLGLAGTKKPPYRRLPARPAGPPAGSAPLQRAALTPPCLALLSSPAYLPCLLQRRGMTAS